MTTTRAALLLAFALALTPALAQQDEYDAASPQGGGGLLPGARFERRLDGGPGYVCSARNAMGTAQCTASCPSRETADCEDAEGGGQPVCRCAGG